MKTNKLYTKTYSYKELTAAVESVLTGPPRVVFSMFTDTTNKEYKPSEPDNWIVDAPDFTSTEPVIEGKVQFMIDYWRVADEPVFSEVYLNPTWVDIANACNDLLKDGDGDGVFLEGFDKRKTSKGVTTYEFCIGS